MTITIDILGPTVWVDPKPATDDFLVRAIHTPSAVFTMWQRMRVLHWRWVFNWAPSNAQDVIGDSILEHVSAPIEIVVVKVAADKTPARYARVQREHGRYTIGRWWSKENLSFLFEARAEKTAVDFDEAREPFLEAILRLKRGLRWVGVSLANPKTMQGYGLCDVALRPDYKFTRSELAGEI
jgi:hypothetical protein